MVTTSRRSLVKRYTQIEHARDMLKRGHLVLPKPTSWDDQNDLEFVDLYKKGSKAEAFYALCFTNRPERYHHWKNFADGKTGVCLEFDKVKLNDDLSGREGFRCDDVAYVPIKDFRADWNSFEPDNLPFLKRVGYGDEEEWRALAIFQRDEGALLSVPVDLGSLNRVIFNPWIDGDELTELRTEFKALVDPKVRVTVSRLTNSAEWIRIGQKIANKPRLSA